MTTDIAEPGTLLESVQAEYWVDHIQIPAIESLVRRFNGKAAKLNCKPLTLQVGPERFVEGWLHEKTGAIVYRPLGNSPGVGYRKTDTGKLQNRVRIDGDMPRLKGWSFLAKLEHESGATICKVISGDTLPAHYHQAAGTCEHCNTKRNRTVTFVLRQRGSEKCIQVGASCLADFTGHPDAESILGLYAHWCAVEAGLEEAPEQYDREGAGSRCDLVRLDSYLSYVAMCVRQGGYIGKQAAEEKGFPTTASDALHFLLKRGSADDKPTPSAEDIETAQKAIQWVTGGISDKLPINLALNYQALVKQEVVRFGPRRDQTAIAASIIASYHKSVALEREKLVSQWLGIVGEKLVLADVLVVKVLELEGRYGVKFLHIMRDGLGNALTWMCSGKPFSEGRRYSFTATVKAHETFRDQSQTQLTRPLRVAPL